MTYKFEVRKRDISELTPHIRGPEYSLALFDLATRFRDKAKYHNDEKCSWEDAYQHLWDILKELNIDPFEE